MAKSLLELVDRYGVPTMAQGRGAPLELAVYIGACILTPHRVRVSRGRLVTTVRELRDFLFGPTWRPGPTGNRPGNWERVRAAALNASDLWLPLENGDLWRAVAVRKIPPADYRPEYLDRQVIFDVELPDGAAHGPVIDRLELARLRLVSGPKFRAYIAAHSVAWRPGVTRRRHPRNRSVHLWSSDPAHYPILTAEARRRLAFGSGDKKNRTRANQDAAWEDLAGVEILTRTAIRRPAQPENGIRASHCSTTTLSHLHPDPDSDSRREGKRRRAAALPRGSRARRRHSLFLSQRRVPRLSAVTTVGDYFLSLRSPYHTPHFKTAMYGVARCVYVAHKPLARGGAPLAETAGRTPRRRCMARPRLGDAERRTRTIGVRVTEAQAAELVELAQAARLSVAALMRRRALGQPVRIAAARRLGAAEFRELNRIGVNLNQMARVLNSGAARAPAEMLATVERVGELVAALLAGEAD